MSYLAEMFERNVALTAEFATQREALVAHLDSLDRRLSHLTPAQRDALFGRTSS